MNFSEWETLKPEKKADLAEEILEEIEEGNMPPKDYIFLHPNSKLDPEEIEVLRDWLQTFAENQ